MCGRYYVDDDTGRWMKSCRGQPHPAGWRLRRKTSTQRTQPPSWYLPGPAWSAGGRGGDFQAFRKGRSSLTPAVSLPWRSRFLRRASCTAGRSFPQHGFMNGTGKKRNIPFTGKAILPFLWLGVIGNMRTGIVL